MDTMYKFSCVDDEQIYYKMTLQNFLRMVINRGYSFLIYYNQNKDTVAVALEKPGIKLGFRGVKVDG